MVPICISILQKNIHIKISIHTHIQNFNRKNIFTGRGIAKTEKILKEHNFILAL